MEPATINDCLAKLNKLSRRELSAEEVYIFPVVLCDNNIDRDFERFSVSALKELAPMFIGKTGIFNHSMSAHDQTARIFDAFIETDSSVKTTAGEEYCCLKAMAYMIRSEKNAELIAEIDAGIKKEVSVGCSMSKQRCSICGAEGRGSCEHRPGMTYLGKLCHRILEAPTDAYEWSFVAVPAQPRAGVVKSFTVPTYGKGFFSPNDIVERLKSADSGIILSEESAKALYGYCTELQKDHEAVVEYSVYLKEEILKLCHAYAPAFPQEFMQKAMRDFSFSELKKLRDAFIKKNTEKTGIPQLFQNRNTICTTSAESNSRFKI